jgi:protein-tyrosine phosphatase
MIDKIKLSELIDRFKSGIDKNDIKSIITDYHEYPQYIIKYITIQYPEFCAEEIIRYIAVTSERRCELIDCILAVYSVRLCDVSTLRDLVCVDKDNCVCYSRKCWRHLYNGFIDLFSSKPEYFISSFNIHNSFTILITKTDVVDEKLYAVLNKLVESPQKWIFVIKFIMNAELYSTQCGDIIFMIRDHILKNDKLNEKKQNKSINDFQGRRMLMNVLCKYNEHQKNMSRITDNIYISDIEGVKNVSIMKDKKIQHVITITKKTVFRIRGIEYTHIMIDDLGTVNFIDETITTVDKVVNWIQNNKIVLVHCYKGLSRSVCFVILVLIRSGLSFEEAYTMVLNGRGKIDPNPEFIRQIETYVANNRSGSRIGARNGSISEAGTRPNIRLKIGLTSEPKPE